MGECLVGTYRFYVFEKNCPHGDNSPNVRSQGKSNRQAQPSGHNSETPKRKFTYALKARGDQRSSSDVVTCRLRVFSVNVYA